MKQLFSALAAVVLTSTLDSVTPGIRGYRLKSVEIGAVNAAEERVSFESVRDSREDVTVTLSSDVATVSGRVTDDGRELDDYRVIVFPVDRTARRTCSWQRDPTSMGATSCWTCRPVTTGWPP